MIQLGLPEEFTEQLKKTIGEAYKSAIEQSRKDRGINAEYLSKQQVMELYDVSNNTLMQWTAAEGLPMFKVGGKIYFSRKKINNFIEKHQVN